MKELYFVRHGQTEWNAIRRMQGQWNSDLTELGREQADVNGRLLKPLGIEYMVASPLTRTRQTAEIITEYLSIDFAVDERIKEWHCGDWSGEMWDEVPHKWPEEFAAWRADQFHYRGPGTENYPDMIERSTPFLGEVLSRKFSKIAIVSHGMIGRAMIGTLLSMSPEEMFSFGQANDTVIHLTGGEGDFSVQHYIGGEGPYVGLPPRNF
ncbi:MAG: histidine phosphatase family protein [Pseudomonas sp.]